MKDITKAYTLSPIKISPTDLLLDPLNPRLISDSSQEKEYSPEEIQSPATQQFVLDLVCRKEHDVKQLIASIQETGFVGGIHEMIVKSLGENGPYLVLEGNRRTAALQYLLKQSADLRPDVLSSIQKIEVKLFNYIPHSEHDEHKVIDVLLGSIHIDGPKEWGALERAHYVHRSYVRAYGKQQPFAYVTEISREVGLAFKLSPKAVHKCLIICRVYEQLRRAEVEVSPAHYSLIDLATSNRAVAEQYFGVNRNICEMTQVGLERFVQLVIGDNAPIHNPKLFDSFAEIFTDGTPLEIERAASGDRDLDTIVDAIRRRHKRHAFRDALDLLKEGIRDLVIDEFKGSEGEKALIRDIKKLVDKRLVPLLQVEVE